MNSQKTALALTEKKGCMCHGSMGSWKVAFVLAGITFMLKTFLLPMITLCYMLTFHIFQIFLTFLLPRALNAAVAAVAGVVNLALLSLPTGDHDHDHHHPHDQDHHCHHH